VGDWLSVWHLVFLLGEVDHFPALSSGQPPPVLLTTLHYPYKRWNTITVSENENKSGVLKWRTHIIVLKWRTHIIVQLCWLTNYNSTHFCYIYYIHKLQLINALLCHSTYIIWPWTTKAVLSCTGIFVAIANKTLYWSKLSIFILWQKSLRY